MYFQERISNARKTKYDFELNSETKQLVRPPRPFYVLNLQIHIFVIRGANLVRSIIENTCWEVQIAFSDKLMICGLKEGIKAVRLL